MLEIEKVDHIGIRVFSKQVSVSFYEHLGFEMLTDTGFDKGHPIIMQHPSGVVLNLLGPSNAGGKDNILMDQADKKYPGITHVSYKVRDISQAKAFLAEQGIELSGEFSFKGMHAIFFRDPDRNVIELDGYVGEEPETRNKPTDEAIKSYGSHPH